jgi:hypothetical protein
MVCLSLEDQAGIECTGIQSRLAMRLRRSA